MSVYVHLTGLKAFLLDFRIAPGEIYRIKRGIKRPIKPTGSKGASNGAHRAGETGEAGEAGVEAGVKTLG